MKSIQQVFENQKLFPAAWLLEKLSRGKAFHAKRGFHPKQRCTSRASGFPISKHWRAGAETEKGSGLKELTIQPQFLNGSLLVLQFFCKSSRKKLPSFQHRTSEKRFLPIWGWQSSCTASWFCTKCKHLTFKMLFLLFLQSTGKLLGHYKYPKLCKV